MNISRNSMQSAVLKYTFSGKSRRKCNPKRVKRYIRPQSHRKHTYFDVVVGLPRSNDLESYDGGSVATGRVSLDGQVKGDDPDPGLPWSSRLGVGREADNHAP
jgi:hypothetical protein